ncbi:MAG: 1,6-anhydro-N-acetylmuramyl-L-alanine amidase AmpD [Pseudomonadota bacterium]
MTTPGIEAGAPDLQIDADGWVPGIARSATPNFDERPSHESIRLVVLHAISLPPGEFGGNAILDLFANRLDPAAHPYFTAVAGQRVSAHFLIRRDGIPLQLVSCRARAWHAGASCWNGQERCNDFSLGIELEGDDHSDFTLAQYATLNRLLATLGCSFPIEAIVGHADVAPGRKTDPGPHFEWMRIAQIIALQ